MIGRRKSTSIERRTASAVVAIAVVRRIAALVRIRNTAVFIVVAVAVDVVVVDNLGCGAVCVDGERLGEGGVVFLFRHGRSWRCGSQFDLRPWRRSAALRNVVSGGRRFRAVGRHRLPVVGRRRLWSVERRREMVVGRRFGSQSRR